MADGNDQLMTDEAPREIRFTEFVECRAHELEAMMQSSRAVKENQRLIQQLPRHMRRRAASHDVRRLPLRLRLAALKEMNKAGPPASSKRPSRRYRRRPGNLLLDYARRKRKHVWLETHIWHAKRFHMTEHWGYKIPLYNNERGIRAAFRSTANNCILLDLSYYICIELTGVAADLIHGLRRISGPPTRVSAQKYIDGRREGRVAIHRDSCYPRSALGEVMFMWQPVCASYKDIDSISLNSVCMGSSSIAKDAVERKIWLWTHPASYMLIFDEIKLVFCMDAQTSALPSESAMLVDDISPLYFTNGRVCLKSLKDELCRFKLIGPSSLAVLQSAIHLTRVYHPERIHEQMEHCGSSESKRPNSSGLIDPAMDPSDSKAVSSSWWSTFCASEINVRVHEEQIKHWKEMMAVLSPAELEPHSIHAVTVRDPRLFLPQKKSFTSPQSLDKYVDGSSLFSKSSSFSSIWIKSVRNNVKTTKLSTSQLNTLRSTCLVPGSELNLGSSESHIPIIVIQNPGIQSASTSRMFRQSHGCGLDVILPCGWSMPFWISLIYRGAISAGLRELRSDHFERRQLLFPDNYPDTAAGHDSNLSSYGERYIKYGRMPPAKRCNYKKLGVVAPFHFPWQELVTEWLCRYCKLLDKFTGDFYVMRSGEYLQKLHEQCNLNLKQRSIMIVTKPAHAGKQTDVTLKKIHKAGNSSDMHCEPCLIPVLVEASSRGTPARFTMICIPTSEDLSQVKCSRDFRGPVEPRHINLGQKKKSSSETVRVGGIGSTIVQASKSNESNIVSISSAKCETSKVDETFVRQTGSNCGKMHKSAVDVRATEATSLKSAPCVDNVVTTSSRLVIGYVVEGGFSYSCGCGVGLGFVTLQGLLTLLDLQKGFKQIRVLLRSPTSTQYKHALLSVNTNE